MHDVDGIGLDIKADMLVYVDKICGLDHPLKAVYINDYLVMNAEEGDRRDNALEHTLFLGDDINILGADDNVNRLLLAEARVNALEYLTREGDPPVFKHNAVENVALADEVGNESVFGFVVDVNRSADLLDAALGHDDDGVGHGKCFLLIVRDKNEGDAGGLLDVLELLLHILAELEVKCGERLVEQKHLRTADKGTRNCYALLLTAGQTRHRSVLEALQGDEGEHLVYLLVYLVAGDLSLAERESDVLKDVQMGEESVTLENGVDVSLVWRNVVYPVTHENNVTLIGILEAADEAESSCLSAAGRAEECKKLVVIYIQTDVVKNGLAVKSLAYTLELDYLFHTLSPIKIKR